MHIRYSFIQSNRPAIPWRPIFRLFAAWLIAASAGAREENQGKRLVDLLPVDTLFFCSVGDMTLALEQADSMPFFKILNEEEVSLFLEKPMARIEAFLPGRDLVERAGIKRAFLAVTRVELPGDDAPPGAAPGIGFVIGAECQGDGAGLKAWFKGVLSRLAGREDEPLQTAQGEYKGVAFEEPSLPLPPPLAPRFFSVEGLQLFTLSETAMKAMVDRSLGGGGDTLANQTVYQETANALKLGDPLVSACYVNLQEAVKLLKAWIRPYEENPPRLERLFDGLGLNALRALGCSSVSRDGKAVLKIHVGSDRPGEGLMGLFPDRPVSEESLRLVPPDVLSVSLGHFDWKRLHELCLECATYFDESSREKIAAFLQETALLTEEGADFERDILGAFGTDALIYQLPPVLASPMVLFPPLVLCFEVKDGGRFLRFIDTAMEKLAKEFPDEESGLVLKRMEYRDHEILYLGMDSTAIALQPAVMSAGKYLAFAYQINDLKRLIQRMENPDSPSILENRTFTAAREALPENAELLSFYHADIPGYISYLYDQIVSFATMVSTMDGSDEKDLFEPALIPTKECITNHLFSACRFRYRMEGKTFDVLFAPFGSEVSGFLLPGGWLAHLFASPGPPSYLFNGLGGLAIYSLFNWRSPATDANRIIQAEYELEEIDKIIEDGAQEKKEGKIK